MKFVAATEEQAEHQAIEYIREHCAARGYTMRDQLADLSGATALVGETKRPKDQRYVRVLPVRYGVSKPVLSGRTRNLSLSGMFVDTRLPLTTGGTAGMLLELEHCRLPLRGNVVWTREQPGPSRPAGMGVELVRPPAAYKKYVHALALEQPAPALAPQPRAGG
jgi:hypothetical protein